MNKKKRLYTTNKNKGGKKMRMRERFQRFMMGRYGVDSFGKFLMGFAFFLIILSFFRFENATIIVAINFGLILVLVYSYFRMFSRNYAKRSMENQKYLNMTRGIRNWFTKTKRRANARKNYKYFSCPKCGKKVRVPRGHGKIMVTCPECKTEFIKKT